MFSVTNISQNYWAIKLNIEEDDGYVKKLNLDVKQPSMKLLRQIQNVLEDKEKVLDEISPLVARVLSRNKTNYKVSADDIEELDVSSMIEILKNYIKWVKNTQNSKN